MYWKKDHELQVNQTTANVGRKHNMPIIDVLLSTVDKYISVFLPVLYQRDAVYKGCFNVLH